jgi:hypothetical protein
MCCEGDRYIRCPTASGKCDSFNIPGISCHQQSNKAIVLNYLGPTGDIF